MVLQGVLTAVGPLHQGGGSDGNFSPVKRATVLGPDGKRVSVPHITGNGIRGMLRRVSAGMTLQVLAEAGASLTYPQYSALVSGGSLSNKQKAWSDKERVGLSEAIPHIATFGVAGGLGMTPGQWQCGDAWPVCSETGHITGVESDIPARALTEIREGVRIDSRGYSPMLSGSFVADGQGALTLIEQDEPRDSDQMIYSTEAIAAGCRFVWSISVADVWEQVPSWLATTVRVWQAGGGHLGGMSARGFGSTRLTGGIAEWSSTFVRPEFDAERAMAALAIVT